VTAMTFYEIHPFCFPTTALFVDDNADFLANLALQLDPKLAFRFFHAPIDALVALNASTASPPSVRSFFSPYPEREDDDLSRHVVDISLKAIHREIYNEERFSQISVAVVDYGMPGIDGLEFCRSIKNPMVKKILLTGEADERVAVRAFNERVIDRFIRKQDPEAIADLNQAIGDMQDLYFGQFERLLSDALSVGSPRFLHDIKFAQRFRQIRQALGIVEYYLVCLPDGMLMFDASGASYLMIVRSEQNLIDDYHIAEDQAAPQELLDAMRKRKVIPYFWESQGFYSPQIRNWKTCLHQASEIQGNEWYLYALIKNPPGFNLKYIRCYNDYLEKLDEGTPEP